MSHFSFQMPEGDVEGLHYEIVMVKDKQFRLKLTGRDIVPGGRQPWRRYRNLFSEIWIEEGITEISEEAFEGYQNLERIVLPESLRTVGKDAFTGCPQLSEICYFGTPAQLRMVNIRPGALPGWFHELGEGE